MQKAGGSIYENGRKRSMSTTRVKSTSNEITGVNGKKATGIGRLLDHDGEEFEVEEIKDYTVIHEECIVFSVL